jgi:hypothetical protein
LLGCELGWLVGKFVMPAISEIDFDFRFSFGEVLAAA